MELTSLGVTATKARQFQKKGIATVEDLLWYLPRRYLDLSQETGILPETEISCFRFRVERLHSGYGRIQTLKASGTVIPSGEALTVTWFNQNYLLGRLDALRGQTVLVAGRVKARRNVPGSGLDLAAPELFAPDPDAAKGIYPIYSKIPGMSMEYLTEKLQLAIGDPARLPAETLPQELLDRLELPGLREALVSLHRPERQEQIARARRRLMYEDLLFFAAQQAWAFRQWAADSPFAAGNPALMEDLRSSLPYALTPDQAAAVEAMCTRAREGKRINALVQGDVGCGKTAIAFLLMAAFAGSGYQTVLMAPTQVLARQHAEALAKLVGPLGYPVAFLGSDTRTAERRKLLREIAAGELCFVVGTHALLNGDIRFQKLALTVTDEEHKFGVEQRAALVQKAAEGVHSITMSATPIPRSLAQVVYGDSVQLHTIRTMPAGREPVLTGIAASRLKIYRFLLTQFRQGRQAYVVCPMIDRSEQMEGVQSVEQVSEEYRAALGPQGVRIGVLTGRDDKKTAEEVVDAFRAGEIDLLISTTVIEVGINIPNATVMVICSAERFGLSSLHQLRGRVGRSSYKSYCVLECGAAADAKSRERLEILCRSSDGFEIAEADLNLRGAGDFIGVRQSGENRYLSLMLAFPEDYERARTCAEELIGRFSGCLLARRAMGGDLP